MLLAQGSPFVERPNADSTTLDMKQQVAITEPEGPSSLWLVLDPEKREPLCSALPI